MATLVKSADSALLTESALDRRSATTEPKAAGILPYRWWTLLGLIVLGLMAYSWGSWLIGGHAHSNNIGVSQDPTFMVDSVYAHEAFFGVWALIAVYWYLIRPWRREHRLTADGILLISLGSIWAFADPLAGYFRIAYLYNSAEANLGCPQCYLPGWQSNAHNYVECPLFGGFWYISMFVGVTIVGCKLLGWYRRRWPQHGRIAALGFILVVMTVFDLLCEIYWIRLGLYTYPNMPYALWSSHYYRVPLMEIPFTGLWYTSVIAARYFTNDKGETWAERGLSKMKMVAKKKNLVRIVASIGMYNAMIFLVYWIPMGYQSTTNPAAWPADIYDRPYFVHGICGPGTTYACNSPVVPVPTNPNSAHLSPTGQLIAPAGLPNQK